MNKAKMSTGSRPAFCSQRSFSYAPKSDNSPVVAGQVAIKATAAPVVTIDFRKMAADAAKMQEYIANGGKQSESRERKFIKPSGLFNSRGVGQR